MSLSREMERAFAWCAEHDDQSIDWAAGTVRRQQAQWCVTHGQHWSRSNKGFSTLLKEESNKEE